jgi:arsenate reductase
MTREIPMKKQKILFACVGNSARSQMAEGFAKKYMPSVEVLSAGTLPATAVNPHAIDVMKEIGIDISMHSPKMLVPNMLKGATHFISMGCGVLDACPFPIVKGKLSVQDWALEDPAGKDLAFFRKVRDEIERRVKVLRAELELT